MYKTRSKNIQRGVNEKEGVSTPSPEMLKARERSDKKFSAIGTAHAGKLVEGVITDIGAHGIVVDVDGIRFFVHVSRLADRHVPYPYDIVSIGNTYTFKILEKTLDKKQKITFVLTMKLNEVADQKETNNKFSNNPFSVLRNLKP